MDIFYKFREKRGKRKDEKSIRWFLELGVLKNRVCLR